MRSRNSGTQEAISIDHLIQRVIGAAINVHKDLGPGFLESIYEEAMVVEFDRGGISYEQQKPIPIRYLGRKVGEHRLDFLVENRLIVENKAVAELEPIFFVVVRSYMKAVGVQHALLLNFAAMPLTIQRVGAENQHRFQQNRPVSTASFS